MHISNQLLLWDQAAITLVNIRQKELAQGEVLPPFIIPANLFLLSVQGAHKFRQPRLNLLVQDLNFYIAAKGLP